MGNSSKRDARKAAMADKRKQALALRVSGASYEQVANAVGFAHKSGAQHCIDAAIKDIYREPAKNLIQLECARLDAMLLGLWQKARQGDTQAVTTVIRIMDRRAAFLGLDAPEKHIVSPGQPEATPAEARKLMQESFGAVTPQSASEADPHGTPEEPT